MKIQARVKNAPKFNQVARNVACIAQVLKKANQRPENLYRLAFYIIAPRENNKIVPKYLSKESIRRTVKERVNGYRNHDGEFYDELNIWFDKWFEPTLNKLEDEMGDVEGKKGEKQIKCLFWEDILDKINIINEKESEQSKIIEEFYNGCIEYNKSARENKGKESDTLLI